jgi:hypothetical protein
MPQPTRDQVFISYSHKDREWLENLQTMLKPLVRKKIAVWDDTKIEAGAKWREEIKGALAAAKVAVLLVSSHFLGSDFIVEHELPPLLKAAEKEGLVILWVYISSCLYDETEIKDYQAAHDISKPLNSLTPAEQDHVLVDVCRKIKAAVTSSVDPSTQSVPTPACPPSGLSNIPDRNPLESIFICYRRNDSADTVDRIYKRLEREFGRDTLFRDIDSMPVGIDFPSHIKQVLSSCCAVLVVIGPYWLESRDEGGRRRLDDPQDYLRIEVETALSIPNMRIIPVRVHNAGMPKAENVPESIRALLFRHGVSVRPDPDFRGDVSRLVRQLRESIPKFKTLLARRIRRERTSKSATASQTAKLVVPPLSDTDLEKLIQWIREGDVVPVLGPSLLEMEINGRVVQITQHFAEILAQRLGVTTRDPNAQRPFEDVFLRFAGAGGKTGRF